MVRPARHLLNILAHECLDASGDGLVLCTAVPQRPMQPSTPAEGGFVCDGHSVGAAAGHIAHPLEGHTFGGGDAWLLQAAGAAGAAGGPCGRRVTPIQAQQGDSLDPIPSRAQRDYRPSPQQNKAVAASGVRHRPPHQCAPMQACCKPPCTCSPPVSLVVCDCSKGVVS